MRWVASTKLAQAQYRRRVILVGASDETARMAMELNSKSAEEVEILARVDLSETPVQRLVEMLHEHSVNGVILSAKHAYFEQVEAAIRACELEGVEAWLVADFFKAQISRTSFDDFYGWPVLVFRSTPESSWPTVVKQVMDSVGSFVAAGCALVAVCAHCVADQSHFARARAVPSAAVRDQRPALHPL